MFKTIKAKLIGGFSLITLLIVLVAIFSVVKINESSEGFTSYREMARASLMSNRVQANMLMVRMNVKDYLFNPVQKEVDEFQSYFEKTSGYITETEELLKNPDRIALLEQMQSQLAEYKLNFEKVQAYMKQRNELVDNGLDVMGPQMEKALTTIMRGEVASGDLDLANKAGETLRTLLLARLYTAKFIKSNTQEDMDRVFKEFDDLNSQIWTLKSQATIESHVNELEKVGNLIAEYKSKVETLYTVINDRNDIVENRLNVIGPDIAKLSEEINVSLKAEQDRIGPEVQQNNENIVMAMIIASAIVALIALLIALFLPRSIAQGLASIQQALNNISSSGDFAIRADDRREDEVGDMGRAVNSLLIDMQKAINESTEVIQAIAKGDFSKRIQANLNGDLDSLKQGINGSADSINDTMTQLSHVMS
ncbi:MAG: HAMP domain-containing protein [Thiomicrorhabdus sp.]|nr:HAMP domain-containing protein [Thiomicrorhabdus sp.]